MSKKRMFSMQIVDSSAFLEMPLSTQCLYFHLNMRADDDGFVDNAKFIMRMIGASDDDMRVLLAKRFVLDFPDEPGIIVIKHWRLHNTLRVDRYQPTNYVEQKAQLSVDANKGYSLLATKWQPNGNPDKISIDKISIDKVSKVNIETTTKSKLFKKPTLQEIKEYCLLRDNNIDPQAFMDYYDSVGWCVGKKPMKDWKACIRTWERKEKDKPSKPGVINWDEV